MDKKDGNTLEKDKQNNKKIDGLKSDPTKEAFLSDMGNIEEEIASEAIELVRHALSLVETQFYDDSIEILRQAIGLYAQINKSAEINALNSKIDEIYLLKEKTFRERELESDVEIEIDDIIYKTEKMAREYEFYFKKAVKAGNLKFDSKYPEVIKIFTEARDKVLAKGWNEDAVIYSTHIRKYSELFEKEKKVREIEAKKDEEKKVYEFFQKAQKDGFDAEKLRQFDAQKTKEYDEKKFQEEIINLVDRAEKMARDYEVAMKKAFKEGKLVKDSPYLEVIEIYTNLRKKILEKGWTEQGLIYTNQIKIYQQKLEKDKKLREIEYKKTLKQEGFEKAQKALKKGEIVGVDIDKLKKLEELTKYDQEEERFEREIDEEVDYAEKTAREYELAIKNGQFEKECPYLEIAETYKKIREKVYARGWKDEAEIYGNQIKLYREKNEKDKRLRELEAGKLKKQIEFEESLKATKKTKPLRYQELEALGGQERETEDMTKQAMNLIDEAEKAVRSYELSLKKDILTYESPYEQAILNYENARKLFQKIGWKEEARRLMGTINFYKDKKIKDDNLRVREQQKLEAPGQEIGATPRRRVFVHEQRIIDFEKLKEAKSKESGEILNKINRAERLAQEYEIKKKEGILNIESPFEEIIKIYKKAKLEFERIGWTEQANQLENTLDHYQDKSNFDKRLRTLEAQKSAKQEERIKIRKIETNLAKKAEKELLKLKTQALEVKRKSAMEYESRKEQAFHFMDLAKKELKQNNFEKAVSYYRESQKIFAEINWPEGIKMIKESINVINLRKERIEREARLIGAKKVEKLGFEVQIGAQIRWAKDLHDLQQAQRRREILVLQEEKEREREISEKAYRFLEEGTKLKDKKKFEEAYEKYIMGRVMFKKIGWEHEVSRINNDLLFILKKGMKQTGKLKAYQQKKVEEKRELEELLKDADEKQKELEKIRKEEKRKQRGKLIQKERDQANDIIKTLRYNEGILALRKVIKKIENTDLNKLIKEINKQIKALENASQVPIITNHDLDDKEDIEKFKLAYQALDKAQISLSTNSFLRAITELNEALFNLNETKIGIKFISAIEDKINAYKKELDIKETPEQKRASPKLDDDDLRAKIVKRREERRKRISEELEVKIGNKERILKILKSNDLTSKEIAKKLNLSEKNTRTYLLRLKKEGKIKSINKKGRFLIYASQRPSISSNQYNEIGALEDDLNYLLNLIEMKMNPKDGVKFTPTDLMNIRRIEERIADKIGGNLKAREAIKDLIDFEQSFKEEINEKITNLEEKVDFITSRKVKSIKDETLETKNGTADLNIEDYLTKPDSVIKFLSDEETSISKDLLVCNVCGAIFSYDYLYCSKCGNKLLKKQESQLIEIHKYVHPKEKIATPVISNIINRNSLGQKRFDRGSTRLKPIFSTRNDQVACENCGYKIVKPFPKDQLCPKCKSFLIGLFEYADNTDFESKKLNPILFEPKTVTASSKIHGVRKKEKSASISLDAERIDLKGRNEYVKFCGITTVDRTPLFSSNKRLYYLLELTNNLDFIATSILGGDLDKMLLKSENNETEKCQFFEKNNIIYILYGKFPDKKGKWVLEQMAKYFSDLVSGKDVNNLSKIDKYDLEKKFKGYLIFIFKEYLQLLDVFSDQEIPYVEDWIRLYYVGLSSMSIGVISTLLDTEGILNVKVTGEFEDLAEEIEMKESLLTAKIEAIAANTLGNTGAYPRWIAVKLGFQQYRFLTFKKYKNDYFLYCLSEGNLKKIEEVEAKLETILHHGMNTKFSGNLRPFNKLKRTIIELTNQVPERKFT